VNPTGIAAIPTNGVRKEIPPSSSGYHETLTQPQYGDAHREEGPYNEVVAAGPYVFTVGDGAVDFATGEIEESVKVPDWIWWGSEIRNETQFFLDRMEVYLGRVGATLADIVHATIYLADLADLYELDRVWQKRFPSDPPAR